MSVIYELRQKVDKWEFSHKGDKPNVILLGQNTYKRYQKELEGNTMKDEGTFFDVPKFMGIEIKEVCIDELCVVGVIQ